MADDQGDPEYLAPERYTQLVGFDSDWRDHWHAPDFLELMARRWRLDEVSRVLDVGSGAGHWGQLLMRVLPTTAQLVGVDREEAFVRMATERAAARGLAGRCSYRVGDARQLPFEADAFDLVTCQTVLIHVDASRVVGEMVRVTKPGGLVAVSEPDNLASTLALLNTSLATPADDIRALIELQQVCERGKAALGEGNSSVGALLPGMFAAAGLAQVRAYASDKCAMLLPPYDTPEQQLDLRHTLEWYRDEVFFTGTENDSRRAFRAGGGDDARFDELWACSCRWMRDFVQAVERGRLHAARGFVGYYVSGRKPL